MFERFHQNLSRRIEGWGFPPVSIEEAREAWEKASPGVRERLAAGRRASDPRPAGAVRVRYF